MRHKKQSHGKLLAGGLILILAIVLVALLARSTSRHEQPAAGIQSASQASQKPASALPTKVAVLTVKAGQVISGPATIQAAPGQQIKMTVYGKGYGEGDNLLIEGYSQSFFELDELDNPTTQYFALKAGTYPLVISSSGQRVGQIVIR